MPRHRSLTDKSQLGAVIRTCRGGPPAATVPLAPGNRGRYRVTARLPKVSPGAGRISTAAMCRGAIYLIRSMGYRYSVPQLPCAAVLVRLLPGRIYSVYTTTEFALRPVMRCRPPDSVSQQSAHSSGLSRRGSVIRTCTGGPPAAVPPVAHWTFPETGTAHLQYHHAGEGSGSNVSDSERTRQVRCAMAA